MKPKLPIDFNTATYDELKAYVLNELILENKDELHSILRGHIFIEWSIETLIAREIGNIDLFSKPPSFANTFARKVELAAALDVLPDKYCKAAKELNKIRNNYAHQKNPQRLKLDQLDNLKIWDTDSHVDVYETACRNDDAVNVAMILLNACFLKLL